MASRQRNRVPDCVCPKLLRSAGSATKSRTLALSCPAISFPLCCMILVLLACARFEPRPGQLLAAAQENAQEIAQEISAEESIVVKQKVFPRGNKDDSVALCLIGEARHFELTGPTIKEHLFGAYMNLAVFVILRLDPAAWKLSVLHPISSSNRSSTSNAGGSSSSSSSSREAATTFAALFVEMQQPINQSRHPVSVLQVPNVQAQLHQFLKIEKCSEMIAEHERRAFKRFDWVMWTRLDSYWSAPPPPLSSLNKSAYTVPARGSEWGGLNDRWGVGPRDLALPAMKRLSMLNHLAQSGKTELNGEKSLQQQLLLQQIPIAECHVSFCVLSFKRKKYFQYPFARLGTPSCMNGISCRPCHQWNGDMCRAYTGYEKGWGKIFDDVVGGEGARARVEYTVVDVENCLKRWQEMLGGIGKFLGPHAQDVCDLGRKMKRTRFIFGT